MVAYSYKKRFVPNIAVGLGIELNPAKLPWLRSLPIAVGMGIKPKRQTIRADRKRHARPGEELQHYCGMRTKGCFLIGRARCTKVSLIKLWIGTADELAVEVDGNYFCGSTDVKEFAQADGFDNAADMIAFWRQEHATICHFEGVLIRWEPLN